MNKLDKIIKFHIDNNLSSVSKKHTKNLAASEIKEIQSALDLNKQLKSLRVSDSFGVNSFRNVLSETAHSDIRKTKRFFSFSNFGMASVVTSALLITLIAGGFGIFRGKTNNSTEDKISTITTDGSVESTNKVNLADIESEQAQLKAEGDNISSVKTDMITTSSMSEAVNEDF